MLPIILAMSAVLHGIFDQRTSLQRGVLELIDEEEAKLESEHGSIIAMLV